MATNKDVGNFGEELAEKYLKKRFWKILSRNFSCKCGEIDIIAYRAGVLAFVEVKTRCNDKYGRPADAVNSDKIRKINNTAQVFGDMYIHGGKIKVFYPFGTEKQRYIRKTRIDVIEVFCENRKYSINHIKSYKIGELL